MRFTLLQESIKKGLAVVNRAVATRSTLPVLSNVLLATDEGRIKLQATNLEIGITAWVGAKVEDEGAVTLPSKLLTDVVTNLPNKPIEFELDTKTQTVTYKCGNYKGTIKGIESDEFPVIPTINGQSFDIPADVLAAAASRVAVAASKDIGRAVLQGVCLTAGNRARFVAADSYRLHDYLHTLETPQEVISAIIPALAMVELGKVLEGLVSITINENYAMFATDSIRFNVRLLDGKYPDVDRIIPTSYATRIIVDTSELSKAIKIGSFYAASSSNILRLHVTDGQLIVSANAAEIGDNQAAVELEATHGPDVLIALNVKYLHEAVTACQSEKIAIELTDPTRPAILRGVGDESFMALCMPMTVR